VGPKQVDVTGFDFIVLNDVQSPLYFIVWGQTFLFDRHEFVPPEKKTGSSEFCCEAITHGSSEDVFQWCVVLQL
jgi:hypothetical protein